MRINNDYINKRLLILSGSGAHYKLVNAAKALGVHTIVVDNVPPKDSPAKMISDESWEISIFDVDRIVEKCKAEHIDGVITCWKDITQVPYCKIAGQLGLPCYGTEEQFFKLSNKKAFKEMCKESGVSVIREFSEIDVQNKSVLFPVFVKPVDGRGSKGQSICNNYDELRNAIDYAKAESISGDIIIEQYIANKNSFQVTYFFVNGTPYVIRTTDGYKGLLPEKLDRVALCSVSPSVYTSAFFETGNKQFSEMLKGIGIKNGPVMVQGFYDRGTFYYYDPGFRFPGTDYELIYKGIFGVDLMQMMVEFALTGEMPEVELGEDSALLNGKKVCILFPTVSSGTIATIQGFDDLRRKEWVHSIDEYHKPGDKVEWTYTTAQRIAEIDFVSDDFADMKMKIREIQNTIDVRDENNMNMLYKPFNVNRLIEKVMD